MIPIRVTDIDALAADHGRLILKDYCIDLDEAVLDGLLAPYRFSDILTAKPSELRSIKGILGKKSSEDFSSILDVYDKFAAWKKIKYCAETLVRKLELTVCPYCNRSFIHSIEEKEARVCQIDHFFSKGDYPYLALSFYNLIPSCYACNHTKSIDELGLSPYEIGDSNLLTFSLIPESTSQLNVELKTNDSRMAKNIEVLGLKSLYRLHNDYVGELADKRRIYSDEYLEELGTKFKDVVGSKEQLLRLIAGNYIQEVDLKKRPLAKLTRDIMLQLKFISE